MRERRLHEHDPVLAREPVAHALEGSGSLPVGDADPRHHAHALRLGEYLSLRVRVRADEATERVVCPKEPLAVPPVFLDRDRHPPGVGLERRGLGVIAPQPRDPGKLVGREHKLSGDEERLGDTSLSVFGGLEGLTGVLRETIQIETVVPVGAADERQPVGSQAVERVTDATLQVLRERGLASWQVVVWHGLVQHCGVA